MSYDVEISTSIAVMYAVSIGYRWQEESNEIKNYVYRSGDAGVSFRGCNNRHYITATDVEISTS